MHTLSQNLKALMLLNDCTAAKIAQGTGVPPQTLTRLLSGKTDNPTLSTLRVIASYFNVSIDQLVSAKGVITEKQESLKLSETDNLIPIVQWDAAKRWAKKERRDGADLIASHSDLRVANTKDTFGLILTGESMYPQFSEGTLLIVNSALKPKNNDFVVAYISSSRDTVFRRMVIDGSYTFLSSINQSYPKVDISDDVQIIGVVEKTIRNLSDSSP